MSLFPPEVDNPAQPPPPYFTAPSTLSLASGPADPALRSERPASTDSDRTSGRAYGSDEKHTLDASVVSAQPDDDKQWMDLWVDLLNFGPRETAELASATAEEKKAMEMKAFERLKEQVEEMAAEHQEVHTMTMAIREKYKSKIPDLASKVGRFEMLYEYQNGKPKRAISISGFVFKPSKDQVRDHTAKRQELQESRTKNGAFGNIDNGLEECRKNVARMMELLNLHPLGFKSSVEVTVHWARKDHVESWRQLRELLLKSKVLHCHKRDYNALMRFVEEEMGTDYETARRTHHDKTITSLLGTMKSVIQRPETRVSHVDKTEPSQSENVFQSLHGDARTVGYNLGTIISCYSKDGGDWSKVRTGDVGGDSAADVPLTTANDVLDRIVQVTCNEENSRRRGANRNAGDPKSTSVFEKTLHAEKEYDADRHASQETFGSNGRSADDCEAVTGTAETVAGCQTFEEYVGPCVARIQSDTARMAVLLLDRSEPYFPSKPSSISKYLVSVPESSKSTIATATSAMDSSGREGMVSRLRGRFGRMK